MAKKRICMVDKTQYEYCEPCDRHKKPETWRYLFCCERCHEIYGVYDAYRNGNIAIADAKNKLRDLNVKNTDGYNERVGVVIDQILKYRATSRRKKKEEIADDAKPSED